MKRIIIFGLLLNISLLALSQQTWTSAQSGLWSSASTWTVSGGASGAPSSNLTGTRVVIITNGHEVTMTSNLRLQGNASLRITNGGKLRMGNTGNPARNFTMTSSGNSFIINNGTYESHSPGSGGNFLLEDGLVDWNNGLIYVSGNYTFKEDMDNVTMQNMCIRVAQNILYEGVGSTATPAMMTNVSHVSGLAGSGNLTFSDNSRLTVSNIRLNASAMTSNLEFFESTMNGTIFSVNGRQKISVSDMAGTTSLEFWCAGSLNPNLNYFSGNKINNCTVAQEICTGVPTQADLSVQKTASTMAPPIGSNITFTITANNNGPSNATGVIVNDVLPNGYLFVSATTSTGTWSAPNWSIGNLNNGANAVLTIVATVNPAGNYTNTATISGGQTDPNNANNSSSVTPVPVSSADLSVTKTVNNATPPVGSNVTFTITALNSGPSNATGVIVNDVLPNGYIFVSAATQTGTWTAPNWSIGNLNNGANAVLTIVATVNPAGNYTNTASISANESDPISGNNSNSASVTPQGQLTGPTANDDNATTPVNVAIQIDILANDLAGSATLDPSSITFVGGTEPNAATVGVFTVNSTTGIVSFAPATGFTGTATVQYQVCDLNNLCDAATITVIVAAAPGNCEITKTNGGGFQTTIVSSVDDCTKKTITLKVMRTGAGHDLSHYAIQAVPGSYSNVSVQLLPGTTMNYTIDLGPNLGAVQNFQGFKVDNISGLNIGEGFQITYDLTVFQNQKTAAKAGPNNFIAEFFTNEFIEVMNCAGTTCTSGTLDNLFPATGFGTLAFEDLWPGKGDYDFNDVVIDYQFEITSNATNHVETVTATFVLRAFGASFENGFGFQLSGNINPNDLFVSGHELTEDIIIKNPNGTEAGQSKPTVIVFDNAYNQMQHSGIGIGVNTTPEAPYVQPDTITITIGFKPNTYSLNDLNIGNFNPFIFVDQVRGHEVHLPNFPPTDLADVNLFGQWEDDSNLATGRFYVTDNNLPWAINIYESFDYPIEKQEILWAYLKFAEWAMSGGVLFPNWYKDLPGFRNNTLIYQIPGE